MKLGTVKNHGFDANRHERLERLEAIVACDACGRDVELWSETEEWWTEEDGRSVHAQYGLAQGVCCSWLYVNSFEGCFRYKLGHLA